MEALLVSFVFLDIDVRRTGCRTTMREPRSVSGATPMRAEASLAVIIFIPCPSSAYRCQWETRFKHVSRTWTDKDRRSLRAVEGGSGFGFWIARTTGAHKFI